MATILIILPVSKEITTFLVNLSPIKLKPFGTPFAFLTLIDQPIASAKGVRIFREWARPGGGLLMITYTRPSFVIAIKSTRTPVRLMPLMFPNNLPLKRISFPVEGIRQTN